MEYASIGSISHATLRTEDLLDAFASELEYHVNRNAKAWCSNEGCTERDRLLKLIEEAQNSAYLEEHEAEGCELVNELCDALEAFAPLYCYFGANEGDGSDFGFWPCMDAIEELPKVSDPSEVEAMGEDCVFVNDHGNLTVYAADGSVIFDCV